MSTAISRDVMTLPEALLRLGDAHCPTTRDLASVENNSSASWDLNTTFNTAREYAEMGWKEKADELRDMMSRVFKYSHENTASNWDVTGECVDIGRFMTGEPECMLNHNVPEIRTTKIMVNIAAVCDADARLLFNRGIGIAAAVYALQANGITVCLHVGESVSSRSGRYDNHETMIEVNGFDQYIDPARLAFWLSHPAALRRCIFRYNEQQNSEIRSDFGFRTYGGYGTPSEMNAKQLEEDGFIYIPFPRTASLSDYQTPESAFQAVSKLLLEQGLDLSKLTRGN